LDITEDLAMPTKTSPQRRDHRSEPPRRERPGSAALAQHVSLLREFPDWVSWRTGNSHWKAARMPPRGRSLPDQVLMWIHARDYHELRTRIRAVDATH
jgi:hypothetical protein